MEKHKQKVSEEMLKFAVLGLIGGNAFILKFGFYLYRTPDISNALYFIFVFIITLFFASVCLWQMGVQKMKYSQIQNKPIFWLLYIIFSLVASLAVIPIFAIAILASGGSKIKLILQNIKKTKLTRSEISKPYRYQLLKLTNILFSTKTQKVTFEQIMADWDFEVFETEANNPIKLQLLMITYRNLYAFVKAIWLKSPIGDLIEFIMKVAK